MFNSQNTAQLIENYPTQQPSPELVNINDLLVKANAEYSDILYSVEDKLHAILNLRTPDKGVQPESKEKSINDFVASIHDKLQTYRNQNGRFQKVLDHLKQIIG